MKHFDRKLVPVLFSCITCHKYFMNTCFFTIFIILFNPKLIVSAAEPPIPSFGSTSFLPLITLNNPETFPENGPPLPDSLIYQQLGQQSRANSNPNSFQVAQQQQPQQQFPQASNIGIGNGGGGFGSQSDSSGQNNGFITSPNFQSQQQQSPFQSNNVNNINAGFSQPLSFDGTNNVENVNPPNDFQQTNPIRNDASNVSPLKRPRNEVLLQQQPTNSGPLQIQTDGGFPSSQINNNNGGSFQQSQPQQQQQNFPIQGNNNGFSPSFSNQYNNFQQQSTFPQEQQQQFSNGFSPSNNNNLNNNNIDDTVNNNHLGNFQTHQNQNFLQQQSQSTGVSSGNINGNNGNNGFQQQGNNLGFASQQQQQPFNGLDNSNSAFSSIGNNNNQFQQNNPQPVQQQQPSGFQQFNNNNNFQPQNPSSNFVGNSNFNQNSLSPQTGNINGNTNNNNNNGGGSILNQVVSDSPLVPSQTSNEISATSKIPQGVQQAQQNAIIDDNVVKGQYRVGLPDGRTQIVRYIALVTYKKENGGSLPSSSQQIPFPNSNGQSTSVGALGSASNVVVRGTRPVYYNYRGHVNDERTEPNLGYSRSFSFGGRIPRKVKRRLKPTPPAATITEETPSDKS